MTDAVAVVSGGMDSVTLAYHLAAQRKNLHLLSFDYGQRHLKELEFASHCATSLGARHTVINLTTMGQLLKGSALTDAVDVPDGRYSESNIAITMVPNRNAVMLAIAYAVAIAEGASIVAAGMHAGNHAIYPDCRPAFIESFAAMEMVATEGYGPPNLSLYVPWLDQPKSHIVKRGEELQVPWVATWSCYKGLDLQCGRCGTCQERREAFHQAGVADPTEYLSSDHSKC